MNNKIIEGFIVFEGIDGSGTTTQMNRLAERLKRLNIPVRCDSEPTGSVAGRRLRTLLKTGNAEDPLFNTTMSSLFSLDRALHVRSQTSLRPVLLVNSRLPRRQRRRRRNSGTE